MTHKRSEEARERRTQKQLARDLKWKFSYRDYLLSETVWTEATTKAAYKELEAEFGYGRPESMLKELWLKIGFLCEDGEVLSVPKNRVFGWMYRSEFQNRHGSFQTSGDANV